ncbi:DNA topoisomerase, partial [Fasciola gigantica]
AIRRAIAQLTHPDHRVSEAVDARQELDLRIGAAFTRFQTLRLRRVFPQTLSDQLISYGSCQFPTLGFVVERFREVDRFVSEPFWRIVVSAERNGKSVDFQWKRGRLFDEDCCRAYYEHLLENRYGQIVEVTKRPKSKWRPVALDTVELEKLATRKLRIGAKAAMQIAERLYTQGYISYPRTETNIFPADMDLATLVRAQLEDSRWSGFATRVLEHGPNPRNGKSTDKAHPPIHPLKPGPNLQANEARLYELITRHFLACLSADAQGAETVILLCVGKPSIPRTSSALMSSEEGELFEAKGLVILQPNYLEVYPYDRWTERDIPDFHLADWILPTNVEMLAGQTSPPPLLTEADLISLMERHGIGTDATHADHIETIKQRLYVGVEQAKFLVPGQLGMGLVEGKINIL